MKILFDQGTPVPLRRTFIGHDVVTAYEAGWATLRNGELLAAAETARFDVLITTDQNLKYQQNLTDRRLAILVLGSTSWPRIRQHLAAIREAVEDLSNGMYREVPIP